MKNEIRLIDVAPLIVDGWVLEKHGVSNCIIGRKSLADVPTIDPESLRPKGRWESDCEPHYTCSNCKHWFSLYDKTNYCPNCGAKMEG